jgi:MFS family permease
MWTATIIGPPLGGLAIGLLGPVVTVVTDAVSYLLSALGIGAIRGEEPGPGQTGDVHRRLSDLLEGWRFILAHQALRPLFFNTVLVNGLIMVSAPLMAVLMLDGLGFTAWQYGLAFGLPCAGGLIGSRVARPLVARFGQHKVMLISGILRACWPLGLAFVGPGVPGLALIVAIQFGLVMCCGIFNPVLATFRLEQIESDRVARTLSAWSITSNLTTAALTALWGLLASMTSPRIAIAAAGVLLLATPLLLPRRSYAPRAEAKLTPSLTP